MQPPRPAPTHRARATRALFATSLALGAALYVAITRDPAASGATSAHDAARLRAGHADRRDAAALRRDYGARARVVLDRVPHFETRADGIHMTRSDDAADETHVVLPSVGSEPVTLHGPGGATFRVREVGAFGPAQRAAGAVSYARDGGRVYWTVGDAGYEEWLDLVTGLAYAGHEVARWEVDDATLAMRGEKVLVTSTAHDALMVVSAPIAWARSGRRVDATLRVVDGAISLSVDADGEAVLVDPSWVMATSSLATARLDHATIPLADGRVLVAGGRSSTTNPLANAEVFDPTTNTWSAAGTLSGGRRLAGATRLLDGRVFLSGGVGNTGTSTIYNPLTNTWSAAATVPSPIVNAHWHTATTLLDGRVLLVGGDNLSATTPAMTKACLYDPATNTWALAASLNVARRHHMATRLLDGRVLVVSGAGHTVNVGLASAEVYDPATNTWTATSPMASGHDFGGAALLGDGKVLVMGGSNASAVPTAVVERYDPATNTWTTMSPMPEARLYPSPVTLPTGEIVVIGGSRNTTESPITYTNASLYDPVTDAWADAPNANTVHGVTHTAAALADGRVLLAAGSTLPVTANGAVAATELYVPTDPNGAACATGDTCTSGICTGGVCCAISCTPGAPGCEVCALSPTVDAPTSVRLTNTSQTTVSYGGYLNGESFQQEGILTHAGYQYAAYWSAAARVMLARRPSGTGAWSVIELDPEYTGTSGDAHNTISLGVSPTDGRLHVAFDHHGNDLRYNYSVAGLVSAPESAVWATSSFQPSPTNVLGSTTVTQVTYPRFVTTPTGKMLLSYRFGASGSGNEVLWEYDDGVWTQIGTYIDGISDSVNAYLHGLEYAGSRLHAAWCWRTTPDASTNLDLLYIYSDDDGRTWHNGEGELVAETGTSVVTLTSDVVAWSIPQNRGLINQEHMTVDNAGRVHVLLSHMPDARANDANFTSARAKSEYFHYYRDTAGTWHRVPMLFPALQNFRGKLVVASDDDLYAVLPNLRIASASVGAGYANWRIIDSSLSGQYFSDPLIDRAQLEASDVLTVFAPTVNTGAGVAIDTITYPLACTDGQFRGADERCALVSDCAVGEHEIAPPTPTEDRLCEDCLTCSASEFESAACADGNAPEDRMCTACDASCATCTGDGATECTSCYVGGVLASGACTYTCTLVPAADGDADNWLGASADGTGAAMHTTDDGASRHRSFLRFDVAGGACAEGGTIPAGASITAVSMTLTMSSLCATCTRAHEIRRMTAAWSEASMPGVDTTSVAGGASHAFDVPASTGTFTTVGAAPLVADVQSFLSAPATNHGWRYAQSVFVGSVGNAAAPFAWATREAGATAPKLVITYTRP